MANPDLRKLLAITMLVVLLINSAGLLCFYLAERNEIRNNMVTWLQTGKADKYCTLLEFPVTTAGQVESRDFQWELTNKEFIYKGNLYDVVSIRIENGKAHIRCVADKAEDHLIQKIRMALHNRKEDKTRNATFLMKFFSAFVVIGQHNDVLLGDLSHVCNTGINACHYPLGVSAIPTPPPEML